MFIRKLAERTGLMGLLIAAFAVTSLPQAYAAPTVLISSIGASCNTTSNTAFIQSNRYIATRDVNIGVINYLIGNQPTTNFLTSYLYIFSDNSAANVPGAILETFTPNVIGGSGSSTYLRFVGSRSIASGTKFWIVPSVRASILNWCNWPTSTSNLTLNGIIPDTSTSGSSSSFRRAYSSAVSPPNSGSWDFTSNGAVLWQLSIEELAPVISGTLSISTNTKYATYRTATTITANVSALSKVSFFAKGKAIAGCMNIRSNAGVATCSWRPSLIGVNNLTARLTSLDADYTSGSASAFEVLVSARTNKR